MYRVFLVFLFLTASLTPSYSQFNDIGAGLTGAASGDVAWGDYDNDGYLDLALCGYNSTLGRIFRIYRNSGGSFQETANSGGVDRSSLAWGDADGNGYLDLAKTGRANSSGGLTASVLMNPGQTQGVSSSPVTLAVVYLEPVEFGALAWSDCDRDGDLDLGLTGRTSNPYPITRIYHNNGSGRFSDYTSSNLVQAQQSDIVWADFDGDGFPDMAVCGNTSVGRVTKIYRNTPGGWQDIGADLVGVAPGSVAWGDYDNDGDPDLAVMGSTGTAGVTKIYRNDNGSFVDIGAYIPGAIDGTIAWGDYDNDGDLDLALTSIGIRRNDGNDTFSDSGISFPNLFYSSLAWGDYDGDGDLDLAMIGSQSGISISRILRNDTATANLPPSAPTGLRASASGDMITFSWHAAADDHTPARGLTYNLRVGTSPGSDDVLCAMADLSTGRRRLPARGNAEQRLSWTLRGLSPATQIYYWSVQAVDTSYAGGSWASEATSHSTYYAKSRIDGLEVALNPTVVTAAFPDVFYIEEDDRSCGIRVYKPSHGITPGMRVSVRGVMRTSPDEERYIEASTVTPSGTGSIEPVGLTNPALGGADSPGDGLPLSKVQKGIVGASGLNNIGLLIKTWGRVTRTGDGYLYVDDGSGTIDGTGSIGVRVICDPSEYEEGDYLIVTGISSCAETGNSLARRILPRGPDDIAKH